ncbi:hypothetical protein J1614_004817 [Plenodomus biglobosus]|nr:hypothetical protein J1614_004817 [Plenodomus biglobosus]
MRREPASTGRHTKRANQEWTRTSHKAIRTLDVTATSVVKFRLRWLIRKLAVKWVVVLGRGGGLTPSSTHDQLERELPARRVQTGQSDVVRFPRVPVVG